MTDNNDYDLPIDIPEDESSYKLLLDEANATDLSEIERSQCNDSSYSKDDWEIEVQGLIDSLPQEHKSTLDNLL
eukprot:gene18065-23712_t